MKKGIILEIDKRYITLLTPDGEFVRSHNQANDYQIGQEITFNPIEEKTLNKTLFAHFTGQFKGKAMIASILTIIIIAGSLFPVYQRNRVYAYMSIDNLSSIEFAVNKDLEVIKVIPYDENGEAVLNEISNWKNQDLSTVSAKIIKEMDSQGFIDQEEIVLSTAYKDDQNQQVDSHLQEELTKLKNQIKADKPLTMMNATKEDRKKAEAQGITTGKLKKNNEAKKSDKANDAKEKGKASIHPEVSPNQEIKKQHAVPQEDIQKGNPKNQGEQRENSVPKNDKNLNQAHSTKQDKKNKEQDRKQLANSHGNENKNREKNK